MTYSIIATDPATGAMGAATATGLVAVGGFVIHTRFGAGAIATQGLFTNWLYGEMGLDMLARGINANEVRNKLVLGDDGHPQRQFVVCDTFGATAGHTGEENIEVKVHHCGENFALAGNMLHSTDIIEAMKESYLNSQDQELHFRLINALIAGEKAGGDFRGTHSAAVKVSYFDRPPLDLRVDWAEDSCTSRLLEIFEKTRSRSFQEFVTWVPTLAEPTKKRASTKAVLSVTTTMVPLPKI